MKAQNNKDVTPLEMASASRKQPWHLLERVVTRVNGVLLSLFANGFSNGAEARNGMKRDNNVSHAPVKGRKMRYMYAIFSLSLDFVLSDFQTDFYRDVPMDSLVYKCNIDLRQKHE
ncbi:hypothetical protein TNCV_3629241 [Trichonephila clavipes]|nr:hypothetical protein TNCV_3629241 [Trichonephila clavipes]